MTGSIRKSTLILYAFFATLWVTGVVPFVMQEITGDKCEAVRLALNAAMQLAAALLGLWTLRKRTDILIIAVFTAVSAYSSLVINDEGIGTWLNGYRRYLGYLFILPVIRYFFADKERRDRFVHAFDRNLWYFLVLQAPCITTQAIRWGIGDSGGGSMGWDNSGVASQLIYMVSFYLMIRRWDKTKGYIGNLLSNAWLVVLLYPSFLNETKVSFIFLLCYFVLLLPMDRNFMKRLFVVIPMLVLLMLGAGYWYLTSLNAKDNVFSLEYMNDYVLGNNMIDWAFELMDADNVDADEIWEQDYARGVKFALLPTLLEQGGEKNQVWGYGLAQFKGGTRTEKTDFAKRYEWFLRGTQTEIFDVTVELGYLGAGLYFLYWIIVFRLFRKAPGGRNKRFQLWLGLCVLVMAFYSPAFDLLPFVLICLYMVYCSTHWDELPPCRQSKAAEPKADPETDQKPEYLPEVEPEAEPAVRPAAGSV